MASCIALFKSPQVARHLSPEAEAASSDDTANTEDGATTSLLRYSWQSPQTWTSQCVKDTACTRVERELSLINTSVKVEGRDCCDFAALKILFFFPFEQVWFQTWFTAASPATHYRTRGTTN